MALFICLFVFQQLNAEKRALIAAVGKYPANSGWQTIHSENDAVIIKSALLRQGFPKNHINILMNEKATKANVVSALEDLIKKTNAGDIVVFHFSGHGQQVTDISGDETDGLDETLVLYDTEQENKTGRMSASTHWIDDEINSYLKRLRKKAGPSGDVLFFIDACHSGTISRNADDAVYRGTDIVYRIPGYPRKDTGQVKQKYLVEAENSGNDPTCSPYVVISACLAGEENWEYYDSATKAYYGTLSFAISRLLSKNQNKTTYLTFFESIRAEFYALGNQEQTPQIEGDLSRYLFAGKTIDIPDHFTVNRIFRDGTVVVNGGELAGIKKGAELSFYPQMTVDKNKTNPVFTAKVIDASLLESIVKIPKTVKIDPASWVFVSKNTFNKEDEIETRANILRGAKTDNKSIALEIIPIDKNGVRQNPASKMKNGNIEFSYGDRFEVVITNRGNSPLYFQLINILPTNEIKIFSLPSSECYLKPGESMSGGSLKFRISVGAPLGVEALLVIGSDKILDLSAIEHKRPQEERGDESDFERFLNQLYSSEQSGSYTLKDVSIDSKFYTVVKSE